MAIKINDIPPEGLTIERSAVIDLFNDGRVSTDAFARLTIEPVSNGIFRVTGRITAEPLLECNRCLERFPFRIDEKDVDIELVPGPVTPDASEHQLNKGELDVEFYEGDEIDPDALVREQLLLAVPMVPVHSPDCRGLCPACGADLNKKECDCSRTSGQEQGPFSILKDLLPKDKKKE